MDGFLYSHASVAQILAVPEAACARRVAQSAHFLDTPTNADNGVDCWYYSLPPAGE
jgi:hypothetical protein